MRLVSGYSSRDGSSLTLVSGEVREVRSRYTLFWRHGYDYQVYMISMVCDGLHTDLTQHDTYIRVLGR